MKRKIRELRWKRSANLVDFDRRYLLTKIEAAERLHISVRTLEKLMREGRIRFLKIGRSVRFLFPDLLANLELEFLCPARNLPVESDSAGSQTVSKSE